MEKIDYDNVLGTCEVMISNIGMDRKLHNKNTHFKWESFESWREDQAYYFLYVTDLEGLIISKQPEGMNEQERSTFNEDFKKELHKNITEKGAR